MTVARILVHLDTRAGLEEKITLHRRHFSRKQLLDYKGVPYRCRRCHKVGHLYKDCPLLSGVTSENSKGKKQPSVEQNIGDKQHTEGDKNQGETPLEAGKDASIKANNRRKAASSLPHTRSMTAVDAISPSGNVSFPITSAIILDVMFSVMHSSLHPPSSALDPILSIPCTIASPPPHFLHYSHLSQGAFHPICSL